jgi:hypothetical protein
VPLVEARLYSCILQGEKFAVCLRYWRQMVHKRPGFPSFSFSLAIAFIKVFGVRDGPYPHASDWTSGVGSGRVGQDEHRLY